MASNDVSSSAARHGNAVEMWNNMHSYRVVFGRRSSIDDVAVAGCIR